MRSLMRWMLRPFMRVAFANWTEYGHAVFVVRCSDHPEAVGLLIETSTMHTLIHVEPSDARQLAKDLNRAAYLSAELLPVPEPIAEVPAA